MNRSLLPLSILLALAATTGCRQSSSEAGIAVDPSGAAAVYSEAELGQLITPGMSLADVTNRFGLPGSAVKVTDSSINLGYLFPVNVRRQQEGPYLTGFSVDIEDGRVVRWSPIKAMIFEETQGGAWQRGFGEQSFQIYLVSVGLTNLANIVESEGSADAGDLETSPDVAFKAQVFAGPSGSERPGEQTVVLVLSNRDASKLEDITQDIFGERLLIVCQNKVIAAPTIFAPLASGEVMFTVKGSEVMDILRGSD